MVSDLCGGEGEERTNMPRLEPVTIAVRFDIAELEMRLEKKGSRQIQKNPGCREQKVAFSKSYLEKTRRSLPTFASCITSYEQGEPSKYHAPSSPDMRTSTRNITHHL